MAEYVDLRPTCQTCAESFPSTTSLRWHIAYFQFKEQEQLRRLIDLQAHLPKERETTHPEPPSNHDEHSCQICFMVFSSKEALNSHTATYQGKQQLIMSELAATHTHTIARPIPERNMKDVNSSESHDEICEILNDEQPSGGRKRKFTKDDTICPQCNDQSTVLQRHFQLHTSCLQICIYCHSVLCKVSMVLQHDCPERKTAIRSIPDKTKERYREDRIRQLRRHSKNALTRLLPKEAPNPPKRPACAGTLNVPQEAPTTLADSGADSFLPVSEYSSMLLGENIAWPFELNTRATLECPVETGDAYGQVIQQSDTLIFNKEYSFEGGHRPL